jgi:putative nucleotidyltransferase with HDIG domain
MAGSTINTAPDIGTAAKHGGHQYFSVPVAILLGLPELKCDLYLQPPGASQKLLYRSAQSEAALNADEALMHSDVRDLHLRADDRELYDKALQAALRSTDTDPETRLILTVEQHRDAFHGALHSCSVAPAVTAAEKIAGDVLQVINSDDFSVVNIVNLLSHDRCTFKHSCNVAIYSATLARQYGITGDDLTLLTTGGLLHDIGKRQIPGFILRKPGKLTDQERTLIRLHPVTGFRELAALQQINWGQLMMTYQHHEWMNGEGYPTGATGDDLHLWARICAVADVFDALTANRPYRESDSGAAALDLMAKEVGHFDTELFELWRGIVTV